MHEPNQAAGAKSNSGTKQSFTPFQECTLYNSVCALDAAKARYKNQGWYYKISAPDKGPQNLKSHLHKKGVSPILIPSLQLAWEQLLFEEGRPPTPARMIERAKEIQSTSSTHKAADEIRESQQNGRSRKRQPVGTKRTNSGKQSRNTKKTNNTRDLVKVSTRTTAKSRAQEKVIATKGGTMRKAPIPKVSKPSFLSQESTRPETQTDSTERQQPTDNRIGMDEHFDRTFWVHGTDTLGMPTFEETMEIDNINGYRGSSPAYSEAIEYFLNSEDSFGGN